MKNLKEHGDPNTTTILVGNKTDLTEKRVNSNNQKKKILNLFSSNFDVYTK